MRKCHGRDGNERHRPGGSARAQTAKEQHSSQCTSSRCTSDLCPHVFSGITVHTRHTARFFFFFSLFRFLSFYSFLSCCRVFFLFLQLFHLLWVSDSEACKQMCVANRTSRFSLCACEWASVCVCRWEPRMKKRTSSSFSLPASVYTTLKYMVVVVVVMVSPEDQTDVWSHLMSVPK